MSAVVRFNPFAQLDAGLDAMFDDLVRRIEPDGSWTPAADVYQVGEDLRIEVDLAGVPLQEINVELKGRTLVVHGERPAAGDDQASPLRREIRRGSFSRAFRLPGHVTAEAVAAQHRDGILYVTIGQARPSTQPHRIEVSTGEPGPSTTAAIEEEHSVSADSKTGRTE